jgi:hypothetical protein
LSGHLKKARRNVKKSSGHFKRARTNVTTSWRNVKKSSGHVKRARRIKVALSGRLVRIP